MFSPQLKVCQKHKPNFRQNPQSFLTNTWHWAWWRLSGILQMWASGIWICMWCILRFQADNSLRLPSKVVSIPYFNFIRKKESNNTDFKTPKNYEDMKLDLSQKHAKKDPRKNCDRRTKTSSRANKNLNASTALTLCTAAAQGQSLITVWDAAGAGRPSCEEGWEPLRVTREQI